VIMMIEEFEMVGFKSFSKTSEYLITTSMTHGYDQMEKEIMMVYDHNRSLLLAPSL
jgi:hypothetical protein